MRGGETRLLLDDPEGARSLFERGLAMSRDAGVGHRGTALEAAVGYTRAWAGRSGLRLLESAIARAAEEGEFWHQAQRLVWLANLRLRTGATGASHEAAMRALELARRTGERQSEALALQALGAVASARGEHKAARRSFAAALRLAQALGLKPLAHRCRKQLVVQRRRAGRVIPCRERRPRRR